MAAIMSLPFWNTQEMTQREADLVAKQYRLEMDRYAKAQKPKHAPIVRHDSMFDDDEEDEPQIDAKVEENAVEEEVIEEIEHKSFSYNLPTENPTWSERQAFSMSFWGVARKHVPSQTFSYDITTGETSFRQRQLFALSFWPSTAAKPSETFSYDVLNGDATWSQRQPFSLSLW